MNLNIYNVNRVLLTLLEAALCVMLSVIFSIKLLLAHLSNWKKPKEQKAIVIIILMAPIYAVVSYVGLLKFRGSEAFFMFLEALKECYEGLPLSVHLNHKTLKQLKYWTWQFVAIRAVCSILMIALQLFDIYPDWISWTFTIILNISVSLALYSLVLFYHVFDKELAPHSPLAKFLCVKGIVFFCFWQGIVLQILVALGIIKSHHIWLDVVYIKQAYQNILVVVEMVFFSILQISAYSVAPYAGDTKSSVKDKKKDQSRY